MPCWVAQRGPESDEAKQLYAAIFDRTFDNIAPAGDLPFYIASPHGDRMASLAGPEDPGRVDHRGP